MPKKPIIELYIEEKAKRKEPIDYEDLNKAFKECEFCNKFFHPSGLPKHRVYCRSNPNRKTGYKETRMWKCEHCGSLFTLHKEFKLHRDRCSKNPNLIIDNLWDRFDQLKFLKEKMPDVYHLLTPEQIKDFLDNNTLEIEFCN